MSRSLNKAERLVEMERLYIQRAFSDIEMAERLGVSRQTVFRDRNALSSRVMLVEDPSGRYKIDRANYLSNIRVDLNEALVLYLAARKVSQQTRLVFTKTASALEKLALALKQPMTEKLVKAAEGILRQGSDPKREKILNLIVQGWVEGRKLRIKYQGLRAKKPGEFVVAPYLIEPSPWSDGVYLIGESDVHRGVGTFKIERIEQASLMLESFKVPQDFDEVELLKHAWGIWSGKGKPEPVKLRFAPGIATRRLKESVWHPLETVTDTEDGGCIWEAPIDKWREMLPWIRGWGAEVEVLCPLTLQKELRTETRKLMNLYLKNIQEMPAHYALWAKAQRNGNEFHPLLYHLIDVGICAQLLWENAFSSGFRKCFTDVFPDEIGESEIGRLLAFLSAIHDLGKASPSFQQKHTPSIGRLKEMGFEFPNPHGQNPTPHGVISTWSLKILLKDALEMEAYAARRFAHVVGGHHGVWPSTTAVRSMSSFDQGDDRWENSRRKIIQELKNVFDPPAKIKLPDDIEHQNMILVLLSGLITTADWLGSDEEFFDYEDQFYPAVDYAEEARIKAQKALQKTGWSDSWKAREDEKTFAEIFSYLNFDTPNPIQQAVIEAASDVEGPTLLILEAPTGHGKTETAFYIADAWLQKQKGRGIYIAMPTQATSNQMFGRTLEFLKNRYPHEKINIHLVHGQALWDENMETLRLASIGEGPEDDESNMRAEAWFLPRKKTLLASFGVGTVDQALMGSLQSRHFFLRLFGLANKVVIFDEVHAYDTYMGKLFLRLLTWLRVLGTSVIILSATLPKITRQEMVKAFHQKTPQIYLENRYPCLTIATSKKIKTILLPAPGDRKINIGWIDQAPESIVQTLVGRMQEGGCVVIICNTVKRAQDLFQTLGHGNLVPEDELILFHSRFPAVWRKEIESKVLDKFKKNGNRPLKAVVIATQIIEQSLDLDFDLMISDLAPIDLLIQRIGRLHRHQHEARPQGMSTPRIIIAQPDGDIQKPDFGGSGYVYAPFILWRTWLAIHERTNILLPVETPDLIENVYGVFDPKEYASETRLQLEQALDDMLTEFGIANYRAEQNLIPSPDVENLVTKPMQDLKDDEDPSLHEQIRAVTRLIPPGVNIVCLHRMSDGRLNLEPDGSGAFIDLLYIPTTREVDELLQHSISLYRKDVVNALSEKTHPQWRRKTALRYYIPVIFENCRCKLHDTEIILNLDRKLGLYVEKEIL